MAISQLGTAYFTVVLYTSVHESAMLRCKAINAMVMLLMLMMTMTMEGRRG